MFKYIFTVILVLILIPQVRRWLFWMIVGKQLMKEQKKREYQQQATTKKQGDININYIRDDAKKGGFKGGEYVDYEEIKE